MNKSRILTATIVMAFAVMLGAFGTHGLKPLLSTYHLEIFKTANFYHFIHGIALFLSAMLLKGTKRNLSFIFFFFGILIFSGSLYILSLQSIYASIPSFLGAITPIGGLLFIAGWIVLGINYYKSQEN